jgi:putative drug exporter of the RND superfamily
VTNLLYGVGHGVTRHRHLVVAVWVLALVAVLIAVKSAGSNTSNDLTIPGSDSTAAQDLLQDRLPNEANGSNPVVLKTASGRLDDSSNSKVVSDTVKSLKSVSGVISVVSPLSQEGAAALSKNGRIGYIAVTLDEGAADLTEDEANEVVDATEPAENAGFEVAVGGYVGQQVSKPETESSEVVGIAAAVIILLFAFGTVVAMGLPILNAIFGLAISLSFVGLLSHLVEVPQVGPTLAIMIGLGVGIDYSLFIITRYRARAAEGLDRNEAIARSVATAGSSVVFAGGTVVIALCSLALANIPLVSALGYSAAVAVLVAVLAANTLLPAVLAMAGRRIDSLPIPLPQSASHDAEPHGWRRWAEQVARRTWPAAILAVVLLAVLAIPALDLKLGQADNGQQPESTQIRQAYDLLEEGFGPGVNGPFLVAVTLSPPAKPDQKQLSQINSQEAELNQEAAQYQAAGEPPPASLQQQQQQLAAEKQQASSSASDPRLTSLENAMKKTDGVKSVSPATVDKSGGAAVITVIPTTAPSADSTEKLVRHLRDEVLPQATKGEKVKAYVGGQTAGNIDLADRISEKLPSVIAIVVGLSFLLLMLAFRSIVVPATAAAMNLLSVGAAYGIVTFVFQEGHGATLIGLEGSTPIVSYVPLLMFAILFGLSMDYQVFLVGRVSEVYQDKADNRHAVIEGLATSGKVITSAALIMVSVFLSFVLNGDPIVKQFGVGMAAAIAVDATIVRCLLVPAVMVLVGRANWWLPGWLDRRLPHIGLEEESFDEALNARATPQAT